jgi:3'(2'), 5'-bisphosphate nucleotidase
VTTETDHELAKRLAVDAGRLLVEVRAELWERGAHPWNVMDTGDASAHRFIVDELQRVRPDDAVLSEEGTDDRRRLTNDRVWIVDPLDGTNEFGEPGRVDWAVHIALWERGAEAPGGLTAGAVSLPAVGMVFGTEPAHRPPTFDRDRPRIITSRNRAPYAAVVIANELGCDAIRLGSAGAKTMAILLGEADIYAHDGGMYQWDTAAPAAVAAAAGMHVSRIDGSPLHYNAADTWFPDFLVCRPELAGPALQALWGDPAGRPRSGGAVTG